MNLNPFYFLGLFNQCLAAASQTLLKKSALKEHKGRLGEYLNPYVIAGYGMLGLCLLIGLVCYRYLGYMESVTLEPVAYILVLVIGVVLFRERLNARRLAGMVLIITGIVLFHLA